MLGTRIIWRLRRRLHLIVGLPRFAGLHGRQKGFPFPLTRRCSRGMLTVVFIQMAESGSRRLLSGLLSPSVSSAHLAQRRSQGLRRSLALSGWLG